MKIFYYFHVSKTGGTSVVDFFKHVAERKPACRFFDFNLWQTVTAMTRATEIDLDVVVRSCLRDNIELAFIHHHHGYTGLVESAALLRRSKEELLARGHDMRIFTTIRDVVDFNTSRLNYLRQRQGLALTQKDFLENEVHFNVQTKYVLKNWFGEWSPLQVLRNVARANLDEVAEIVDLFVDVSKLTEFLRTFAAFLQVDDYKCDVKKNKSDHNLTFTPLEQERLRENNDLDMYLLRFRSNFNDDVPRFFR
jgi:hypothetical protein